MNPLSTFSQILQKVGLTLSLGSLFCLIACDSTEKATVPVIRKVQFIPADASSVSLEEGLIVSGEHLSTIQQVFVNDSALVVNAADISDSVVRVTLSESILYQKSNKIRLVTKYGTAETSFSMDSSLPSIADFFPSSGATGDTITITGNHLNDLVSVDFDKVTASVISSSANEIRVKVPSDISIAHILVTTKAGAVSSTQTFGSQLDYVIYDDALNSAWWQGGYGSSRPPVASTAQFKRGAKSVKFTPTGDYNAIQFGNNNQFSVAPYKAIRLSIFVEGNTDKEFKLYVKDPAPNAPNAGGTTYAYFFKPKAGEWIDVIVKLSEMSNPTQVPELVLQNMGGSAPATVYLDEIGFVK